MEPNSAKAIRIDGLTVSRAYFNSAIPLVLSLIVTIVYGLVDMYFVSATEDANLIAGVSLIAPVYTMLMAFGDIFGYGGGALLARYLGKKDHLKTKQISAFSFWSSLGFGTAVGVLLLLFRVPFVRLLGADADTSVHAADYFFWIALAAPFVLVYCTFLNMARSDGKAKEAMIAVVAGTVVNLLLDPLFIFRLDMGAAGASLSTFIGMFVEAAGCVLISVRRSDTVSVSPRHVRLDRHSVWEMLSVGFSSSLTNVAQMVMLVATNLYLASYSTLAVSAMGIVQKVTMISYLLLLGFALGAQPLLGRACGAGQKDQLRAVLALATKVCLAAAILLTAVIEIFAPRIMSLFIDDREIVFMGRQMLRIQYAATVFQAFVLVVFSLGISVGDARTPFVLSVLRQGVVFLGALFLLSSLFGYYGVLSAQPAADLITACIAFFLLNRRLKPRIR